MKPCRGKQGGVLCWVEGVWVRQNSWSREFQKEGCPMSLGQIGRGEELAFLLRALRRHGRGRGQRPARG